jgi:hypothetical protein
MDLLSNDTSALNNNLGCQAIDERQARQLTEEYNLPEVQ